ncbi:hypothetical protein FJT64_027821 [Amphibalanus amphitrite]|uniref:Uncharacterized protein n=1 Tax=Amphibalanus amphitrite TaxID=1232801 RepID=A0A6A4VZ23_AMPAM|nr:hypothetical protein FJT64_027821 [Amphibalanus amphitrite]
MSFFNNFIQNVSNTVSNLNLSPKRFPFGARQEGAAGLQRTESAGGAAAAAAAARGRGSPLQGAAAAPPVGSVGRTASLPAPCGPGTPKSPRSSQKKRRAKLLLATSTQKRDILYETSNSGQKQETATDSGLKLKTRLGGTAAISTKIQTHSTGPTAGFYPSRLGSPHGATI